MNPNSRDNGGSKRAGVMEQAVPRQQSVFADSAAYERFMGRWSRKLAPLLVTFAGVDDGDAILDVGSGTGALAAALIEAFPSVRVTAIDPSDSYIRYATERVPERRATFEVGDAQAIHMADGVFDKTLSLLVINFIPNPTAVLREMIRVTRSGGVVAVAVWDYGDGMEMLRIFWDAAVALDLTVASRDERHMPLCRRGELATLWRDNGLKQVEEEPMVIDLAFDSFEDYWVPFLGGQGPAGALATSLSEPERSSLEAELRRRLLGEAHDGPFTLRARAWAVKGVV